MNYSDLPEEKREKLKEYQRQYQKNRRENMTEEDKEKRREYLRKYRELNRDKINTYANVWKHNLSGEKADKKKQWQKQYYQNNKEKIIERIKQRWATMTEEERIRYNEKKRQRFKIWYFLLDEDRKKKLISVSRKWIDNNKELHAERNKQYYQQNKKKKDESGKVPTTQPG